MIKRLEQLAALVVAAGLALVSYWLFFSWAQGGGAHRRQKPGTSSTVPLVNQVRTSQATAGLEEPLFGGAVVKPREMLAHLVSRDGQTPTITELNNALESSSGILESLAEQGLREI
jgi:hypothetical protein